MPQAPRSPAPPFAGSPLALTSHSTRAPGRPCRPPWRRPAASIEDLQVTMPSKAQLSHDKAGKGGLSQGDAGRPGGGHSRGRHPHPSSPNAAQPSYPGDSPPSRHSRFWWTPPASQSTWIATGKRANSPGLGLGLGAFALAASLNSSSTASVDGAMGAPRLCRLRADCAGRRPAAAVGGGRVRPCVGGHHAGGGRGSDTTCTGRRVSKQVEQACRCGTCSV